MKEELILTWPQVRHRAGRAAELILELLPDITYLRAYPVPNGGIPSALSIQAAYHSATGGVKTLEIASHPNGADVIIDDLVDSGATRERFKKFSKPFITLIDKQKEELNGTWVKFPWELMANESGPQDSVRRMLQYIGEDPRREGLLDTPKRVVKAWDELFEGYKVDPEKLLTVFESDGYDEMVVLKGIEFVSFCEHHILPFYGQASIAYIPNGKVIGISKLARLLEVYSRRLQIQERLCKQITDALDKHLQPLGSACVLEASHSCMTCRGVKKQNSRMITSSLTGTFKTDAAARSEFMQFVK